MLSSLRINNIAVIEKADVEFSDGFNVLTGETGAGKSIVIDSINAVLGNRTSKELIRAGEKSALVSAVFTNISDSCIKKLNSLGFESVERELSILRTISDSKSTIKINGQTSTSAIVREIAPYLINIHGQHDSQALLNPEKHYVYIDLLADNAELKSEYKSAFDTMQKTRKKLKNLTENFENNEKRAELLRFQVNELENAEIYIGEIEELKTKQTEINNSKTLLDSLMFVSNILYNDNDDSVTVLSLIDKATSSFEAIADYSKSVSELNGEMYDIREKADEIRDTINSLIDSYNFDKSEIERVESRLDMYYGFYSKYGKTEQEMLDYFENAKNELRSIELDNSEIVTLQQNLKSEVEKVKDLGKKLTLSRKKAADEFSEKVKNELIFLDMPKVEIVAEICESPYSKNGADKIEFMISTNPGTPLMPLAKIASGGEMSRIMLAIKNVLAKKDPVDTLIFDEIDSGISGHAATKVGLKLKQIAKDKQVLCVTHLAQIAALSDNHLLIEKNVVNERAVTTINSLDADKKREEIARIVGSAVTEATLSAADELINATI